MRKLLHALASLYPAKWREQYGPELHTLLDDAAPAGSDILDLIKGGALMQLSRPAGMITVFGILGGLAAAGFAFTRPPHFVSTALIRVKAQDPEAAAEQVHNLSATLFKQPALAGLITDLGLYDRERSKKSVADVVNEMKQNLRILPVDDNSGRFAAFAVEFSYPDPHFLQALTQRLVAGFIDENIRQRSDTPVSLMVLDPASLPKKPVDSSRGWIIAAGLLAGAALGLVLARMRRRASVSR